MTSRRSTGSRKRGGPRSNFWVHVVLISGLLFVVFPFFWEVATSLKTYAESTTVPPTLLPSEPQISNYQQVFDAVPLAQQFTNSFVSTLLRTTVQVMVCAAAGYAFARISFPFKNLLFALFLAVMMVPAQLYLLSQYQIVRDLGLLNTIPALALPGMFGAFGTFLMRQYYLQMPRELDEAAKLDGCNPLQTFVRVMLPLSVNGLLALGILTAIWSWNDLLWPLIVNTDPERLPLSAGLTTLQGQHVTNYPVLMAGAVLASLPMLLLFTIFQRQVLQGVAAGAVKG